MRAVGALGGERHRPAARFEAAPNSSGNSHDGCMVQPAEINTGSSRCTHCCRAHHTMPTLPGGRHGSGAVHLRAALTRCVPLPSSGRRCIRRGTHQMSHASGHGCTARTPARCWFAGRFRPPIRVRAGRLGVRRNRAARRNPMRTRRPGRLRSSRATIVDAGAAHVPARVRPSPRTVYTRRAASRSRCSTARQCSAARSCFT